MGAGSRVRWGPACWPDLRSRLGGPESPWNEPRREVEIGFAVPVWHRVRGQGDYMREQRPIIDPVHQDSRLFGHFLRILFDCDILDSTPIDRDSIKQPRVAPP